MTPCARLRVASPCLRCMNGDSRHQCGGCGQYDCYCTCWDYPVDVPRAIEAIRPILAEMGTTPERCRFYLFERIDALYADVGGPDGNPWNRMIWTPRTGWMGHDGRIKL